MSKRIIGYNLYLKPHHPTYYVLKGIGLDYLPVKSPTTTTLELPDVPGLGEQPAYMLDMSRLTPSQQTKLMKTIAATFQVPLYSVGLQIATFGMPILARDCDPPTAVYAQ